MEPYHRVSWCEFYDQGMLLPFGALNAHHNTPNTFLFDPEYGYTLGAGSDPLQDWPLAEVMRAGERYHVPVNDLYGCLFFYLREQLTTFAERLATMDLEFRLTAELAQDLAPQLQEQGVLLDCIDASNIADANYCGIKRVLQDWGPLLNWRINPEATLVTLFMNWIADMPELEASLGIPKSEASQLIADAVQTLPHDMPAAIKADVQAMRVGRGATRGSPAARPLDAAVSSMHGLMEQVFERVKERRDYSATLQRYLQLKGAPQAAAAVGLQQRSTPHRLVPPRFFMPVSAAQTDLPYEVWSEQEVYLAKRFTGTTLVERYVEWMGSTSASGSPSY